MKSTTLLFRTEEGFTSLLIQFVIIQLQHKSFSAHQQLAPKLIKKGVTPYGFSLHIPRSHMQPLGTANPSGPLDRRWTGEPGFGLPHFSVFVSKTD